VRALADGELTPGDAAALSGVVRTYVDALDARDQEARLCALEGQAAAKPRRR
jgi:hypothetical protein